MSYTEKDREIIKSFAYGYTVQQVADNYDISLAEAKRIQKDYSAAIEKRRNYLKEQGWI